MVWPVFEQGLRRAQAEWFTQGVYRAGPGSNGDKIKHWQMATACAAVTARRGRTRLRNGPGPLGKLYHKSTYCNLQGTSWAPAKSFVASSPSILTMSTDHTSASVSSPKRQLQAAAKSKVKWLGPVLLTVRVATASAEIVPFPYVKGVFGTITTVLEAVEKVKKNRDVLKELCEDIAEITNIARAKLSEDPENGAGELEDRCKELDSILQDVLTAVQKMQKPQYFLKELFATTVIKDEISGYQDKIKKLLSNFMVELINSMRTGTLTQITACNGYKDTQYSRKNRSGSEGDQ
ncbi:hypothetical protein GGX14DRAFT_606514 [Mycena pura]|uniref:Uncharacterized protein n=1 Tax=Mycena pura TaxID=153505 RepID=A0AAD6ULQ2_9AGAR|nr:hypothetical protein GGX14DRAFT_606514 [Mycena pura]